MQHTSMYAQVLSNEAFIAKNVENLECNPTRSCSIQTITTQKKKKKKRTKHCTKTKTCVCSFYFTQCRKKEQSNKLTLAFLSMAKNVCEYRVTQRQKLVIWAFFPPDIFSFYIFFFVGFSSHLLYKIHLNSFKIIIKKKIYMKIKTKNNNTGIPGGQLPKGFFFNPRPYKLHNMQMSSRLLFSVEFISSHSRLQQHP